MAAAAFGSLVALQFHKSMQNNTHICGWVGYVSAKGFDRGGWWGWDLSNCAQNKIYVFNSMEHSFTHELHVHTHILQPASRTSAACARGVGFFFHTDSIMLMKSHFISPGGARTLPRQRLRPRSAFAHRHTLPDSDRRDDCATSSKLASPAL